nr:hypothetical protein [Neobacillus sp. Marseille-Q6967]
MGIRLCFDCEPICCDIFVLFSIVPEGWFLGITLFSGTPYAVLNVDEENCSITVVDPSGESPDPPQVISCTDLTGNVESLFFAAN